MRWRRWLAGTLVLGAVAAGQVGDAPEPPGPRIAMLPDLPGGAVTLTADEIGDRLGAGPNCRADFPGCPRVLTIDAAKMPFIARNIMLAHAAGKPEVLFRGDPAMRGRNYYASCGKFIKTQPDGSCDEYPFASAREGGAGAQIAEVPKREQNCQGGTISRQYQNKDIEVGFPYLVVVTNGDHTAKGPYVGDDIGDKGAC